MVLEDFACEINLSAAYALTRNSPPLHLFTHNSHLLREDVMTKGLFCHIHGRRCSPSRQTPELFVSGFSCKAFSTNNGERWSQDPVEHEHFSSFLECKAFIAKYLPKAVVLENVEGVNFRRTSGCKGTGLDEIMKHLQELSQYSWHVVSIDSVSCLSQVSVHDSFLCAGAASSKLRLYCLTAVRVFIFSVPATIRQCAIA